MDEPLTLNTVNCQSPGPLEAVDKPAPAAPANTSFSLLIKPAGADCNLQCEYCFYRSRAALYPDAAAPRMSRTTLERLISGYMALDMAQHVFGWQGGEPTLMGVDFFREVTRLQQQYGRAGAVVSNGLQTNGTLLDDEFAGHLASYRFLVGVSLDGPPAIHDRYRHGADPASGSHAAVMRGIACLRRRRAEFNILTLVTAANVRRASEVYRYLCGQGFNFQQFIPCVEYDAQGGRQPFAIAGGEWGDFLCELFDCWRPDAGRVSIRLFDSILARILRQPAGMCSMENDCRQYFLVEHNGDVYPCDFFVDQRWRLGNIAGVSWAQLRQSPLYAEFGRRKQRWAAACAACPWLEFCAGDCPKHRGPGGGELSRLCEGWRVFFRHAVPELRRLAAAISAGPAANAVRPPLGRNAPCPCGSGRKYKHCCGR